MIGVPIEMPETCEACLCNVHDCYCGVTGNYFEFDEETQRAENCPLIKIDAVQKCEEVTSCKQVVSKLVATYMSLPNGKKQSMKKDRVIECLKKEVRCHSDEQYEECQKYSYCHNCPCTYPEQLIDVIKAALELLEGENNG